MGRPTPVRVEWVQMERNMGKLASLLVGTAVGAALGLAVQYLFGPARGTAYDQRYQSRLDYALAEGRKAADAQEAALRRQFEAAKRLPSSTHTPSAE